MTPRPTLGYVTIAFQANGACHHLPFPVKSTFAWATQVLSSRDCASVSNAVACWAECTMSMKTEAKIEGLCRVSGKAEVVNGEIVLMSPTGGDPGYAGDEAFVSLREYALRTKKGRAVSDNKAFRVHLPNRESFSPDAAYYLGPNPGMKFFEASRSLPSRSEAKAITVPRPSGRSWKSVRTTSLRERLWCGMSICLAPM